MLLTIGEQADIFRTMLNVWIYAETLRNRLPEGLLLSLGLRGERAGYSDG